MLKVKRLDPNAKLPTVGHPGEDLGYDLYSLEDVFILRGKKVAVRTGIAATFSLEDVEEIKFGLLFRDRSSMAAKGITVSAGVIDAGYTGELMVLLTNNGQGLCYIKAGDRICQMLPTEVFTAESIVETQDLEPSSRGMGGFGSTGA